MGQPQISPLPPAGTGRVNVTISSSSTCQLKSKRPRQRERVATPPSHHSHISLLWYRKSYFQSSDLTITARSTRMCSPSRDASASMLAPTLIAHTPSPACRPASREIERSLRRLQLYDEAEQGNEGDTDTWPDVVEGDAPTYLTLSDSYRVTCSSVHLSPNLQHSDHIPSSPPPYVLSQIDPSPLSGSRAPPSSPSGPRTPSPHLHAGRTPDTPRTPHTPRTPLTPPRTLRTPRPRTPLDEVEVEQRPSPIQFGSPPIRSPAQQLALTHPPRSASPLLYPRFSPRPSPDDGFHGDGDFDFDFATGSVGVTRADLAFLLIAWSAQNS